MSAENCMVNINGQIFKESDAKISVFDRGFLYGDSVYEVFRVYQGVIFQLQDHLDRLKRSASKIGMELPFSEDYLSSMAYKTIEQLNGNNCYLRLTVTRGVGPIGLDPDLSLKPNLVIIAKSEHEPNEKIYQDGVAIIITEVLKTDKDSIDPNLKSGNYLNNIMAFMEAKKQGAYDAIMLNRDGMISEATTANVWIVDQENRFITPPLAAGILEGITKKTIIDIAKSVGIVTIEKNINKDDLLAAKECFLSSSFKELVPVVKVGPNSIGNGKPGQNYQKIHNAYRQEVKSYIARHHAKKI